MSAAAEDALHIRLQLPRSGFMLDVDLQLPGRGITVLFGASGSGKTTVLRCVAGLERAPFGRVQLGSELWQDSAARRWLPTWQRPLGYVFQEASLFEHLSVQQNLQFGLCRSRAPEGAGVLAEAVRLLGIEALLGRAPAQLSGGERQRVAIARALATQPRLLLLDEPLAALDHARKREILPWLERLRDELRTPMLYVTHSADELARLADHVVLLEAGRLQAQGPAAAVLSALSSPVLTGDETSTLLPGELVERDEAWHLARVAFAGGSLWLRDAGLPLGRRVRLRVLARDVSLATEPPRGTSIQNQMPCLITGLGPDSHPSQMLVQVQVGEPGSSSLLLARVTARAAASLGLAVGQGAWLQVKSVALLH